MKRVVACSLLALTVACGNAPRDELDSERSEDIAQSSSELSESALASLEIVASWCTGYCAKVKVTNAGQSVTNTWTAVVDLNTTKLVGGWDGHFATKEGVLTITPWRSNAAIAPGTSATPAPKFCALRSNGAVPSILSASANYCSAVYLDSDGDGYGDPGSSLYTCDNPSGYVSNHDDCCDSDERAHPGQETYFWEPNKCGSYDYNCDGVEAPGLPPHPLCTGAFQGCSSDCTALGTLPPECGGSFLDYGTSPCGAGAEVYVRACYPTGPSTCGIIDKTYSSVGALQVCR